MKNNKTRTFFSEDFVCVFGSVHNLLHHDHVGVVNFQ